MEVERRNSTESDHIDSFVGLRLITLICFWCYIYFYVVLLRNCVLIVKCVVVNIIQKINTHVLSGGLFKVCRKTCFGS